LHVGLDARHSEPAHGGENRIRDEADGAEYGNDGDYVGSHGLTSVLQNLHCTE
jgi:hypothetical protein